MFTEQSRILDELVPLLNAGGLDGTRIVEVFRKYTANCVANYVHRGSLSIEQIADAGRRDATLTVKRWPAKPDTLATANPSNGYAIDIWGMARFRGHVQFDQGGGGGGPANFEELLALFPAGFKLPWHDAGNIPTGWAIMDGVANSVGNGGSGENRGGRIPYGYISGDPTFGTLGDPVDLAFSHSGFPIDTVAGGTNPVTVDSATTGITVSNHASGQSCTVNDSGHTHSITVDTEAYGDDTGFTSPVTVVTNVGSTTGSATTGITVTTPTLTHTVNDSGHSHTAEVDLQELADNFTINTPSVIRPPGFVDLWIEKLS